jgi:hypothetical protein
MRVPRRFAIAAAVALMAAPAPAASAVPTVTLESQAWWRAAGISVPSQVGQHVHLTVTVPADGAIVDGQFGTTIGVLLHAQPSVRKALARLRFGSESVTLYDRTTDIAMTVPDSTRDFAVTIDFGRLSTGRHELRFSAMVDYLDGTRQFQSTGYQVCVRSCSPSYRSGSHTEARGWYSDRGYANAKLTTPVSSVRSGGTIGVRLGPGSGGKPTTYAGVFIDPDFHAGLAGTIIRTWAGPFTGSVTLPTVASGAHRLVLLSSDGRNAGVQVIGFSVP